MSYGSSEHELKASFALRRRQELLSGSQTRFSSVVGAAVPRTKAAGPEYTKVDLELATLRALLGNHRGEQWPDNYVLADRNA